MQNAPTDTYHVLGNIIRFLMRSRDNGGVFSMVEVRTRPGAGAPPNRHAVDQEAFFVLSGSYEFVLDGKSGIYGAGSFVRVPDGKAHSFKNVGDSDATMIILNWPGEAHDKFFTTVGDPLDSRAQEFPPPSGPPDVAALVAVAKRCGIELLI